MTDVIDRATDKSDAFLESALAKRPRPPVIHATGQCLWCGDGLPSGHRWCGVTCRDLWQFETSSYSGDVEEI